MENMPTLQVTSPRYAAPLSFRMLFEQLLIGGSIAGLVIGTVGAVFVVERGDLSVVWLVLVQVGIDIFRAVGVGLLFSALVTFVVWHILWIGSWMKLFPSLKQVTLFTVIALLIMVAIFFFAASRTTAEIVLFVGACLFTPTIIVWRARKLEGLLNQKLKNS